jgi:hypothetical protein
MCAANDLTALWFQHSQMEFRFHDPSLIGCDGGKLLPYLGTALQKPKLKPFSVFYAYACAFSGSTCLKLVTA